jgi:hypothetical protein
MTQYLLAVHGSEDDPMPEPEEMQQAFEAVDRFNAEIMASGAWVFGGGLEVASTATVVRAEGDSVVLTDGPFVESKEHIGGFWIIEVEDLDAALAIAARASVACRNPVEVRPFQAE